jgi:perosamine synthetase
VRFRALPPAAAPLSLADLWFGLAGLLRPQHTVQRLETELAAALRVERVRLTSSGRAALTLILRALASLSPRRRVVIPAYTCFSVPASIVKAGLEVTPCDINPQTFDFDFDQLRALIDEEPPLCVMSTHLFGLTADVARARALCREHGVFVVEDAAQVFGDPAADRPLGTLGDVGFYSFGRGKPVTAVDGGAIVTNSAEIARALDAECRSLPDAPSTASIGALVRAAALWALLRPSFYWIPDSMPWLGLGETVYSTTFPIERLSGAQAGLLRRWRERARQANRARGERVEILRTILPAAGGSNLSACIRFPFLCASKAERDVMYAAARRRRLGFSLMYPAPVNRIPELQDRLGARSYPNANGVAERLLTIPVHPFVSNRDERAIVAFLRTSLQPQPECSSS